MDIGKRMEGMNELSLFSGAGGGLLATKHLLGFRTIGYVEWDDYCQRVLAQRIRENNLDDAPIFGDIRTFISEGYARRYKGMVDIITDGFPCQPFSVAGKQKKENDERNMWPSTREVIEIIKSKYVFLENVTNLISCGYIGDVLKDLSVIGYDIRWVALGARETGSIVQGERLWIFAFEADSTMLESMDIQKYIITYSEESCRRQYTRAVSAMLSQDDYAEIKRNPDEVARGMDILKAIGNGQDPIVAATAFRILSEGLI